MFNRFFYVSIVLLTTLLPASATSIPSASVPVAIPSPTTTASPKVQQAYPVNGYINESKTVYTEIFSNGTVLIAYKDKDGLNKLFINVIKTAYIEHILGNGKVQYVNPPIYKK